MRLIDNKNILIKDVRPKITRNGKWSITSIQLNLWCNQELWINGLLGSNDLLNNIYDDING